MSRTRRDWIGEPPVTNAYRSGRSPGYREPKAGYQGTIYPVVERDARLVLVAGFATFAALRDAGAAWITAYTLEAANERELLELAAVLAMSSGL